MVEAVEVVGGGGGGEEVHGEEQDLFERIGFQEPQSKGGISLASQLQLVFHSWRQGRVKDHFTHSQNYSNPSFGYRHLKTKATLWISRSNFQHKGGCFSDFRC